MTSRLNRLRWSRRLAAPLIFLVFMTLSAVVISTGPEAAPAEPGERVWPVSVMTAEPDARRPLHRAWGRLESAQVAALRSRLTAAVDSVAVREGQWVEAGDVLVELDREDVLLDVRAARAARDRARAALESAREEQRLAREMAEHHEELKRIATARRQRFESLHDDRMISDAQLDEARQQARQQAATLSEHRSHLADLPNLLARHEAELAEAQARLERAERDLAQSTLVAPFRGRVLEVSVARGDRALNGDVLLRMADYDSLRLRVSLPAELAGVLHESLENGIAVTARPDDGGSKFRLQRLAASVRDGQGGVDAFFSAAADPSLVIGALYGLRVELPPEEEVIPVPVHALYEGDRIYRVSDGRLESIRVRRIGEYAGPAGDYRILVSAPDIRSGDRLLTTQLPEAVSGLRVEPVNAASEGAADTPELARR